jgi:hypothetical protein
LNIWIYIGIVNVLLAFKLWWDYRAKTKFGRVIDHKKSVVIDGCIYVVSSLFLFNDWFDAIGFVIIAAGYRWLVFDLLFNWLNGWKWNHEGFSAKLDKFMKKMGPWAEPIKIGVIIVGYLITLL